MPFPVSFDPDELRTARAAVVAAAKANAGLNPHGRRVLVAQSLAHHVKAAVKALRSRELHAQKLAAQAAAETKAALERLPVPPLDLVGAIASAARGNAELRERISMLAQMAGAGEVTITDDDRQLLFALAGAPAGEIFGLTAADLTRAREARQAVAANTPKVIELRAKEADARRAAHAIHSELRALEPDLDARALRDLGAMAPRPQDLSEGDSLSWQRADRQSWVMAAADHDDAFRWRDERPASETAA